MGAVPDLSRRAILGGGALLAIGAGAPGLAAQRAAAEEILPLWPGRLPGDPGHAIERKVEERIAR